MNIRDGIGLGLGGGGSMDGLVLDQRDNGLHRVGEAGQGLRSTDSSARLANASLLPARHGIGESRGGKGAQDKGGEHLL